MQGFEQREHLVYLSYDTMERWLMSQAPSIRALKPALCVGILRGGSFPAMLASFVTDAPLAFVRFDRKTGEVRWDQSIAMPEAGTQVLLCEDLAGSGVTLLRCKEFLEQAGLKVSVLTIFHDSKSRMVPDFSMDMSGKKVVLPWERHTALPGYVAFQSKMNDGLGHMPSDGQWERWGFDLDGVFLDDIHEKEYERDLQNALQLRLHLPKDAQSPTPPENAIIITGRPKQDESLTRPWLEKHGLAHLPLNMRDESKYSAKNTALYKALMCFEHNITHFWESDLHQAVNISRYNPSLRVLWWNVQQREGLWVWGQCAQMQVNAFQKS